MTLPQLAIVIPAYNSSHTITDCLRSIKQQNMPCYLIVVDDHSTDDTAAKAAAYADLLIRNTQRLGKAASINKAAADIAQQYTLILDSDTYLERGFIQKLLTQLRGHNYLAGSGTVKAVGRNKFGKREAEAWGIQDQRYNGCCQFFQTEFLRNLRYDENCLVEDEELYCVIEQMDLKQAMIQAYAYTETPRDSATSFHQKLRWVRGSLQLARRGIRNSVYRHYVPLLFVGAFELCCLGLGVTALLQGELLGLLLFQPFLILEVGQSIQTFGSKSNLKASVVYSALGCFINIWAFIEVAMFNRKLTCKHWKR